MPENKVKKYFKLVEVWAWCDICENMVNLRVDKQEIINGLQTGIYTKEYKHINPNPDEEDPDDVSGQEHTIYVYINDRYDVTGVKSFFGDAPSMMEMEASVEGDEIRIPIVVKEIPEMSVHLGMLTPEEFKILKICDGMNTLEQVASIAQKSVESIETMMDKLRDKGLVKVIKREKHEA
ncbi:MAG: hypothetical protein ACTSR8_08465 [Promethearchaeota archaeon]